MEQVNEESENDQSGHPITSSKNINVVFIKEEGISEEEDVSTVDVKQEVIEISCDELADCHTEDTMLDSSVMNNASVSSVNDPLLLKSLPEECLFGTSSHEEPGTSAQGNYFVSSLDFGNERSYVQDSQNNKELPIQNPIKFEESEVQDNKNFLRLWFTDTLSSCGENIQSFKCNICQKKFSKQGKFQWHMSMMHKVKRNYECKFCGRKLSNISSLKNHVNAIHMLIKKYECAECGQKCVMKQNLVKHLNVVHRDIRNFRCEDCFKMFSRRKALSIHVEAVHKKIKNFICNECNCTFSQRSNLTSHINVVHKKIKDYVCKGCNHAFPQRSLLKNHYFKMHKDMCDECGMKLSDEDSVRIHKSYAHNSKFQCNTCSKTFTLKSRLRRHLDTRHKIYRCSECYKTYTTVTGFKIHVTTVHRGLKKHACEECEKKFAKPCDLKNHIDVVHRGMMHECGDCGQKFTQKTTLKNHVDVVHKGVKNYTCFTCNKKFMQAATFRKHMIREHDKSL